MDKIRTLVLTTRTDYWASLRSISANLSAAYQMAADEGWDFLPFSTDELEQDIWMRKDYVSELSRKIVAGNYARIIVKDSHMHIPQLIARIERAYPEGKGPQWIIHLFGDFTLRAKDWEHTGQLLQGRPVRFVCASDRQAQLVRAFLKGRNTGVDVIPYPVDGAFYRFSPEVRAAVRKKLRLSAGNQVLLYTGRLSQQKNIPALIAVFRDLARTNHKLHLFLAGTFDDIGSQTLQMIPTPGYQFFVVQKALAALAPGLRKRVHFVGEQSPEELRGLYCAADVFVSASLYHDEDYGMSVAEALSSGLPCVLTKWGGYAAFPGLSSLCETVPVPLGKNGFTFPVDAFAKKIIRGLARGREPEKGEKFSQLTGMPAVSSALRKLLRKPAPVFNGFSELIGEFGHHETPIVPGQDALYRKVYSAYARGNHGA